MGPLVFSSTRLIVTAQGYGAPGTFFCISNKRLVRFGAAEAISVAMRRCVKILALIIALHFAGATFVSPAVAAETPMTKADCRIAGMKWKGDKCVVRSQSTHMLPDHVRKVLAGIGLVCTILGLIVMYRDWHRDFSES
jgi:hypothetical protein